MFAILRCRDEINSYRIVSLFPLQQGANLIIQNVQTDDEGTYVCLKKKSESEDISEYDSTESDDIIESDDRSATEVLTVYLRVRAPPGPVSLISVRLSTVLGVLMWEFPTNHSGGYPIISFTAEYRNYNETHETDWERLDPNNIPANVVSFPFDNFAVFMRLIFRFSTSSF